MARELGVGLARPHDSIAAMVADPAIDCLWLVGPNRAPGVHGGDRRRSPP